MVAFSSSLLVTASTLFAGAMGAAVSTVAASAVSAVPAAAAVAVSAASAVPDAAALSAFNAAFNPNSYTKKYVTCNAVERSANGSTTPTKLKLAYLDINSSAKKTLIMVHGWPSLWTTYRNQITGLGSEYRLILPENRGFGDSQHPKDLYYSNTMPDFVNDIMCIMDNAKVSAGVCVGNDFGAQVCWEAGRMRPDRFIGVFNVGIPYVSAAIGFSTNEQLAALNKNFTYQVYFGNNATGAAEELNADPRSSIRSCAQIATSIIPPTFLQLATSFLQPWWDFLKAHNLKQIPFSGIMTPCVEDYMVASYEIQGFFNTFNGYQPGNRLETYNFEISQGNFTIPQPTFTLFPTRDPVANWALFAEEVESWAFLPNYQNATIATAHWPHEEQPAEFNSILLGWLPNVTFPKA